MLARMKHFLSSKGFRIFLIIILLWLLFAGVIYPLVAEFCVPPIIHHGIELYENQEFLEFDKGDVFQSALSTIPMPENAAVQQFVYYNHCLRDSLFYGKMCDVFFLETSLGEQYEVTAEYILQHSDYCYDEGRTDMHWLQEAVSTNAAVFFVTLNEKTKNIRCILLTERDNTLGDALGAEYVLFAKFGIDLRNNDIPVSYYD